VSSVELTVDGVWSVLGSRQYCVQ